MDCLYTFFSDFVFGVNTGLIAASPRLEVSGEDADEFMRRCKGKGFKPTPDCACYAIENGSAKVLNSRGCLMCLERVRQLSGEPGWEERVRLSKYKDRFICTLHGTTLNSKPKPPLNASELTVLLSSHPVCCAQSQSSPRGRFRRTCSSSRRASFSRANAGQRSNCCRKYHRIKHHIVIWYTVTLYDMIRYEIIMIIEYHKITVSLNTSY